MHVADPGPLSKMMRSKVRRQEKNERGGYPRSHSQEAQGSQPKTDISEGLYRAVTHHLDMYDWHGRHFHLRYPRGHSHPRANCHFRGTHQDLAHRHCRNSEARYASFKACAVRLKSLELGCFAIRKCLPLIEVVSRPRECTFRVRHRGGSSGQRTRRSLRSRTQHASLGYKLIGVACRQRQDGIGVVLNSVCDAVCPLHAAIVITCVQSGCQHRCRQPSPCLCFHGLTPYA
jgi:hypothetical protein